MVLSKEQFVDLLRIAPLVAIDLMVLDAAGKILLGRRRNRPAKGYWFVPGGRIRKDERLDQAFERLTHAELGFAIPRTASTVEGLYDHHYEDNVAGVEGVSTHYVVIPHRLVLDAVEPRIDGLDQHAEMRWFSLDELLAEPMVHRYSRAYFEPHAKARPAPVPVPVLCA